MSFASGYSTGYSGSYTTAPAPVPPPGAYQPVAAAATTTASGATVPPAPAAGMTKQDYLSEFFSSGESIDEFHPRTLYVGNLDASVSEEFLISLFAQMGTVSKCKIIHETANEPYAFVEFTDHNSAVQALTAMNKRLLLGKEMRVNWATSPGTQIKVDTSKHFHAFVGDLSPEIDNKTLKDAFAPFGEISDVKVIRDLQTLKSKGYGFVSFVRKEDAEKAIEHMNGQWLGRRTIRTNWATRRPGGALSGFSDGSAGPNIGGGAGGGAVSGGGGGGYRGMTFEEIMNQASPQNCTVYVGGITATTTEDDMRKHFAKYGTVMEIKVFKQQGFSFVRFDNKESAAHAIMNVTGSEINGSTVRCSWGKEGGVTVRQNTNPMSNYGYGYGYGTAPAAAQNYGAAANYWSQYYSSYYNPAMYQQWASYYQQQPQGGQQGQ